MDKHRDKVIEREASKAGFRGKVNAKCCECIYDSTQPGSWRKQVEKCTAKGCPLYPVRPTTSAKELTEEAMT